MILPAYIRAAFPSYASMGESYPAKQRKHAIFRLPTRESEIFFALFNSSTEPVRVQAGLEVGRGSQEVTTLTLAPKQWKSIRLPRDLPERTRGRFDLGKAGLVGGVTLDFFGISNGCNTSFNPPKPLGEALNYLWWS